METNTPALSAALDEATRARLRQRRRDELQGMTWSGGTTRDAISTMVIRYGSAEYRCGSSIADINAPWPVTEYCMRAAHRRHLALKRLMRTI